MQHSKRLTVAALAIAGLQLSGCRGETDEHAIELASHVEHIEGTELARVVLSESAIQRIDLMTDEVRQQRMSRSTSPRTVVPYSALIYDPHGRTWIYTSPEPRTFIRHQVEVDYIEGDMAVLTDGPPIGTVVASVGVAELYGTEFEVGH